MVCGRQGEANAAVASAISRGADCREGRIGSFASDRYGAGGRGMSASPPIATELILGCELTRSAISEHRPDYSITSSARTSSVVGTSRPRALAVLRLISNSYFVGACAGRSPDFSPLRMRST
jgi:hypothetical protein